MNAEVYTEESNTAMPEKALNIYTTLKSGISSVEKFIGVDENYA
jgi:hypothetical protein